MVFDERKDEYVLTSGRRVYANNGIIGIDHAGDIWEGYDGELSAGYDAKACTPLTFTDAERSEIADAMIARWSAWREGREDTGTQVVNAHADAPQGRAVSNLGQIIARAWEETIREKLKDGM